MKRVRHFNVSAPDIYTYGEYLYVKRRFPSVKSLEDSKKYSAHVQIGKIILKVESRFNTCLIIEGKIALNLIDCKYESAISFVLDIKDERRIFASGFKMKNGIVTPNIINEIELDNTQKYVHINFKNIGMLKVISASNEILELKAKYNIVNNISTEHIRKIRSDDGFPILLEYSNDYRYTTEQLDFLKNNLLKSITVANSNIRYSINNIDNCKKVIVIFSTLNREGKISKTLSKVEELNQDNLGIINFVHTGELYLDSEYINCCIAILARILKKLNLSTKDLILYDDNSNNHLVNKFMSYFVDSYIILEVLKIETDFDVIDNTKLNCDSKNSYITNVEGLRKVYIENSVEISSKYKYNEKMLPLSRVIINCLLNVGVIYDLDVLVPKINKKIGNTYTRVKKEKI